MYGCIGKIVRVDLTSHRVVDEKLDVDIARKYFGGRGLGAKILFEELKPGIDPLGPENTLVFAAGPVTGVPFPGNSRYVVMAKSPLTGLWGEANSSGFFGSELKFAGYDAVVVEGKADSPVYLWIHDGEVEIKDAIHLWGKVTGGVQKTIRAEQDDEKIRVASIGPGGENLVRFACVINDLHRAAGRCGMGAVMGSKKLKAVAVRGTRKVEVANKEGFKELLKKAVKESLTRSGWVKSLMNYGTAGDIEVNHATGRLPTQAFRKCTFEGFEKISGQTMTKTILKKRTACYACPVACIRVVEAKEPYEVDPSYGGPEYETCASFGSLCMNDNLVAIAKANELCNKYSIDTISAGVVIAFAMECYEKKLITKEETGGIDLNWGNYGAVVNLVEKIAKREGVGDILAEGVVRAAEKIGRGADSFALHVKGQELPMHEPRGKKGLGLSYAISNRGACHLQVPHDDDFEDETYLAPEIGIAKPIAPRDRLYTGPEKVKLVITGENLYAAYDTLVVCKFTAYPWGGISPTTLVDIVRCVTGWDITPHEMMTVGERAFNLCRAFNVREGITRKDDNLPERVMKPLPEGMYKGEAFSTETLDRMLDYYYENRGWDVTSGIPTDRKLKELELDYVAEELTRLDKL
jgi:aldehyde:ferredoxin oxidoreductase